MNTAFQIGATIGVAGTVYIFSSLKNSRLLTICQVLTAITLGVNDGRAPDPISQFEGYEASFWSLVGLHGMMALLVLITVH